MKLAEKKPGRPYGSFTGDSEGNWEYQAGYPFHRNGIWQANIALSSEVIEIDGSYLSRSSKEDFINGAEDIRGEIEEYLAAQFDSDFQESPGFLYHTTDEENVESIMEEGLLAQSRTRGLTNRGVGAAIFTYDDKDVAELGHYGSVIIQIDTAAMKRDGVEFQVEQEPAVTEYEAASCLASAIDCDDHTFETGGDGADDPATVILHVGVVDAKYLKVM